jgi:hypothetical protein
VHAGEGPRRKVRVVVLAAGVCQPTPQLLYPCMSATLHARADADTTAVRGRLVWCSVLAVIQAVNKSMPPYRFTDDDVELMNAVAAIVCKYQLGELGCCVSSVQSSPPRLLLQVFRCTLRRRCCTALAFKSSRLHSWK